MPLPDTQATLARTDELLRRVTARLDQLGCRVCDLRISSSEDALILHGQVATNYAKDLVQYVVIEISGRSIMSNEVQVE